MFVLILAIVLFSTLPAASQIVTPVTCRAETTACATANVAAMQGAINSFGNAQGGIVQIADGTPINKTIVVKNNVMLKGFGFGSSTAPSPSSYFKWLGPSGQPMFLFQTYFGGGMANVRLIGNSASQPSAAIQLDTLGDHRNMQFGTFDNLYIGEMYGLDTDQNPQFQDGILLTGTTNEDTQKFGLVVIAPVKGIGVHDMNANAGPVTFENLAVKGGTNCIWTNAPIIVHSLYCATSGYNLVIASPGTMNIGSYFSERSGGVAQFVQGLAPCCVGNFLQSLFILDGGFQVTASMVNPIVDVGNSTYWKIIFNSMKLQATACPYSPPLVRLANAGYVYGYYRGTLTSPGCGVPAGVANYVTGPVSAWYAAEIYDYQVGGSGGRL